MLILVPVATVRRAVEEAKEVRPIATCPVMKVEEPNVEVAAEVTVPLNIVELLNVLVAVTRSPFAVMNPAPETSKTVLEFTSKSIKSTFVLVVKFAPKSVPDAAFPCWNEFGPKNTRAEDVD